MTVGEVVLESLTTGVITEAEVGWLATHQESFSRAEEAAAIRLGRLMDDGEVNLGCRIANAETANVQTHHQQVLSDWIEPLGRNRGTAAA
jgi:hypothetical protein